MRDNDLKSTILYTLRKNQKMTLKDLTEVSIGRFNEGTMAAVFFEVIIDLFKTRFISISDCEIVDYLKKYRGYTRHCADGYDFISFLKIKIIDDNDFLSKVEISLTEYFYRIQDVIGFSITDLYEKASNSSSYISVHPIWGKPDKKITCDVFVIMPFENKLTAVYEDHILKVCKDIGLDCKRADLILDTGSIINDIWSLICNAHIIICDCTGKNPNVFYELGIAHSLGKKTICITQNSEDIPFDIKHLRYIKYEYTPRGMKEFEKKLEEYIAIANSESFLKEREF